VTFFMAVVIFAGSLLLTLGMRTFARQKGLLAHPNERSSHVIATPHGGGLAIMIAFCSAIIYLLVRGEIEQDLFWALFCVVPIVIAGQIDDIFPVPARYRMLVQAVCAIGGLYMLGGIDTLAVGNVTLNGWWLNAAALFYVIWMTNLYNFIDGIDGYAASEAVYVGMASFLLFGNMPGIFIAAAAAGFLIFNWHKASIFMGDVGSAPLGFIFAILSLSDADHGGFVGWLVLLSLFWFDATITLWRRFRRGERLSSAHKKHAYQRLVQSGWAHDRVVRYAMGVNLLLFVLLWLAPESAYGAVLIVDIFVLYALVRYVDHKKAFS
jgi:Fuc2NAc and GlcNAc transferase